MNGTFTFYCFLFQKHKNDPVTIPSEKKTDSNSFFCLNFLSNRISLSFSFMYHCFLNRTSLVPSATFLASSVFLTLGVQCPLVGVRRITCGRLLQRKLLCERQKKFVDVCTSLRRGFHEDYFLFVSILLRLRGVHFSLLR